MEISISGASPAEAQTDLLVLVAPEQATPALPPGIDELLQVALRDAATAQGFRGNLGQTVLVSTLGRLPAPRLALVGAGRGDDTRSVLQLGFEIARLASTVGARSAAVLLSSLPTDTAAATEALTRGLLLGTYRFDRYLTGERRPQSTLQSVAILHTSNPATDAVLLDALRRGERVAWAQCTARDLVNEPAGVLTPRKLAEIADNLARTHGLDSTLLGPDDCRRMGMGLLLAVAQGSAEEPRFIHLTWKPDAPRKRIALVGKGITFDSGGLSLKTREGMLGMKGDMAGAAAVILAATVAAIERLPIEVHAIAPCCENMPSGTAVRLNDIIRSLDGRTVEITNTDAEGRLILADALTYARNLQPDAIIDVATLTGACIVALGPHIGGVMSTNEQLASAWLQAADVAGEEMWRLPLPRPLFDQLRSDVADLKNSGDRHGAALIAALFLREFVGEIPWLHADIAGPAMADKDATHAFSLKGATGFGAATLIQLLRRM